MKKIVGLDFDNTIINYDDVFYKIALKQKLISTKINKNKESVKNFIIKNINEERWTQLQGEVYGKYIYFAKPFKGAKETIHNLINSGYKVYIISHKTKYPYLGIKYNLHISAYKWLVANNFINRQLLSKNDIFFLNSIDKKINKIHTLKCNYFVDDLIKVLKLVSEDIKKIHFSKYSDYKFKSNFKHINNWDEISSYFDIDNTFNKSDFFSKIKENNINNNKIIYSGRNSEVRKVKINKKNYVIKKYLSCNRMLRDIKYITFLRANNYNYCPNYIYADYKQKSVIFNYIEGGKIKKVYSHYLIEVIDFIVKTNKSVDKKQKYFSKAVDACLCINDHLKNLNNKIKKLLFNKYDNKLYVKYENFIRNSVILSYKKQKKIFLNSFKKHRLYQKINSDDLIISPSDIGFHNIIKNKNILYYLDFEYSGLDDPLKLFCDFICNPEFALNDTQINFIIEKFNLVSDNVKLNKDLLYVYLPIYRLKWVCIILNDFTKEKIDDKKYQSLLKNQLFKAKKYYIRHCS